VNHIYNSKTHSWDDSYEDLPTSPFDGSPILLVPRRVVRALPWINYDDFLRTEFSAYLRARRDEARRSRSASQTRADVPAGEETRVKSDVVTVTRNDIGLVERYVKSREQQSANAQPTLDYVDEDACREAEALKERLAAIAPGREGAA